MAGSVTLASVVTPRKLVVDSLWTFTEALQLVNSTEIIGENAAAYSSKSVAKASPMVENGELGRASTACVLEPFPNFPSDFPSVKRIPGTRFVVDGFRSAGPWSATYFLSHFHSDHYTGLTNSWNKGLVFCSEITAHLVKDSLLVKDAFVVQLPMGRTTVIDGCEVTLVDANHCPGAVQFLFRIPGEAGEWRRYVHCGDMRYSPAMKSDSSLCDFIGSDAVFLDTTYCNPKFVFPPQQTSVEYVAKTVERLMAAGSEDRDAVEEVEDGSSTEAEGDGSGEEGDVDIRRKADLAVALVDQPSEKVIQNYEEGESFHERRIQEEAVDECRAPCEEILLGNPNPEGQNEEKAETSGAVGECKPFSERSTLFLISTYVIGKEKILTAVAKRCNCKIYVTEKKLTILRRLDIEEIEMFTTDPVATNVHVVKWSFLGETWPYFRPNFVNMEKAMHERGYKKVIGFVPTGWTYELNKKRFSVRKKGTFEIHLVPYSEHSNYEELREYVGFLRPQEIIPTVGIEGGGMDSKALATMRKHFRNLVDETASKRNFLKGFRRKPPDEDMMAPLKLKDVDYEVAPKAVFSRAARKRCRDTDEVFVEMGAKRSLLLSDSQLPARTGGDMIHHGTQGLPEKIVALEEKKLQECDSETLIELSEAYLEEDSQPTLTTSQRNVDNEHKGGGQFKSPSKQQQPGGVLSTTNLESGQNRLSTSAGISNSQRGSAGKRKRPQDKLQTTKKKVSSTKKLKKSGTSSHPFKKINSSPSNLVSKNQKAMQSSILNFFKKTGEDVNPSQIQLADGREPSTIIPEIMNHDRNSVHDSKIESPEASEGQIYENKWADEYEQLASILDGNLSKEQAYFFLEKAGGNVGIALDLFYSDQNVNEVSCTHGRPPNASPMKAKPLDQGKQPTVSGNISGTDNSDNLVLECSRETTTTGIYKSETSSSQMHPSKWADEYEQLASILDGSLSKEDANVLLDTACGDVAIAFDLFHRKQSTGCQVITPGGNRDQFTTMQEGEVPSISASTSTLKPSLVDKESKVKNALQNNASSVAVQVGKYAPLEHACWELGAPAPYIHLARAFDLIEQETGRLKTADMLCNMFRSLLALSPEAVLPAVYLTTNRIAPDFESGELSIGGSLVSTAIAEVAGVSRAKLREMYTSMGDLGDVAQACRQTQSSLRLPPPLGICQVFSTLKQISKETGTGSGARKKDLVLSLLRACREKETKYIVRTLVQNMRIGAMMKTVLSALAQAVVLHRTFSDYQAPDKIIVKLKPKFQEASAAVVEAYNFLPNLDLIVPTMIKDGVEALAANFTMSPGTPIKPMLAKITNGIPELLKRFQGQPFTCEYKYDGQRAQIHMLLDGTIRIFTRDSGDATGRFPDVINISRQAANEELKSFIIDAEVVAVDRDNNNKLMAFQHLSTRERGSRDRSSVNLQNIKVDICVFVFDMMFANNESLVKLPLQERRKCMRQWFPNTRPGYFEYASQITIEAEEDAVSASEKVQGFLDDSFSASCEGLMAKALLEDSSYMASKRSDSWLKIKRDYLEGLQDSIDLVPIGAWHGNGRKAGWFSPFLLACYDPDREEYQSVCRVMSGFTDVFYKEMIEFYSGDHILPRKPPYYRTGEEPDVWFSPELVWEIRGADFTVSPVHQAAVGLIHPSRGISIRFPRFIRSRPDKKPDIATTPSEIADLFQKQSRKLEVSSSTTQRSLMAKSDSD